MKKKIGLLLLTAFVFNIFFINVYAENDVLEQGIQYIMKRAENPQYGDEWIVLNAEKSGFASDEYIKAYKNNMQDIVSAQSGILSENKYTEYSRVVTTLGVIGENPKNFAGFDLTAPLLENQKVKKQGITGVIWALIALDCAGVRNEVTAGYISDILSSQLENGGFSFGDDADPDVTAMAICALANHKANPAVKSAIEKAVNCLSELQNENGVFEAYGCESSESISQVIIALCTAGVSPEETEFIKNGNTLYNALLQYKLSDGSFMHDKTTGMSDMLASVQAMTALSAYKRFEDNESSVYSPKNTGNLMFADTNNSKSRAAIEDLALKGIINGKTEGVFEPYSNMTRAEFAAVTVRALSLYNMSEISFRDVSQNDWFYGVIGAAVKYGIVNGISDNEFNPNGVITQEEACVMLARAAKVCGMYKEADTENSEYNLNYSNVSDWAEDGVRFCIEDEIINASDMHPKEYITREEIAQMLFNMLKNSELI